MGLKSFERATELQKIAAASNVDKNIDALISKQAYEDIVAQHKILGSLILGIDIIERITDKTILAGAKLAIPGRNIIIPIVYSNGLIESTTFIYNQDTDIMLGLTKKIVEIITTDSGSIDGSAVSTGGLDRGSIHKLFVPPRTFSPKIASVGLLVRMMETSDLLKQAVYKKILTDWDFRNEIEQRYEGITKFAQIGDANIKAEINSQDHTPPTIVWSRKEIFDSDWIEKQAAIREYSVYGYAVSEGKDFPSLSLRPVETTKEKIMSQTNANDIESFTTDNVGAFILYSEDGESQEVFSGEKWDNGYSQQSGCDAITEGIRVAAYIVLSTNAIFLDEACLLYTSDAADDMQ